MKKIQRVFAALTFIAIALPAFAQPVSSTPAAPTFDLADVHPSAHTTNKFYTGGLLRGDRYVLNNATIVDMVSLAYGLDNDNVLSGPAWLDTDRFDIAAHAPRGTSPDDVKLMLQALLAQRFHLVLHKDSHPIPTFVLRVDKSGNKLKQADESEASHIEEIHTPGDLPPGVPAYYTVVGHNQTMDQIRDMLQNFASAYLPKPVADATGLKGGYDFNLHWTWQPKPDGLTIFDAVSKQLGLKLALEQYPTPVVIIDSLDEKPTANTPGLDKVLPPQPLPEFEVSVLTPSKPDAQLSADFTSNSIKATGLTPQFLIGYAWGLNTNDDELVQNGPKWMKQDKWDLLAKSSPESQPIGPDGKPQFDFDMLPHMVQTMMVDRFQLKYHMEDRIVDAFTLVASGPHMQKADPLHRTGCKEGPGPDGKDPRIANPILGRLVHCQNMTMAQLADQLPNMAGGYIFTPVKDATGLKDAFDFTLSFSTAGQLQSSAPPTAASVNNGSNAAEPNGGLSLPDAMARQLGVKLVKEKRPSPVLVIDHIEEKPTDN